MHDPVESSVEWFTDNGYVVKGVVHVGANDGKEIAWYVAKNYRPVLAFEPHPAAFAELKTHYWNHALLWPLALGAENGTLKLYVPTDDNTERSSKYKPIPTLGHDWTMIPMNEGPIDVPLARFDSWATRGGIDLSPFNTLVIDVQGMELEVLEGFGDYLKGFANLVVECSRRPVYKGEPAADKVVGWLIKKGFTPKTPIEEHDNVLFVRESASQS
jgi:FkbM family methyltransferase